MLTSTADGFVAAGSAKAADGTTQAVLWTSRDGAGQSVLGIYYAAASGEDTVISGALGRGGSGTWLSTDGGSTWTQVTFPAGHGAENTISGLGSDGSGLSQAVPATASPIFSERAVLAVLGHHRSCGRLPPRRGQGQRLRLRRDRHRRRRGLPGLHQHRGRHQLAAAAGGQRIAVGSADGYPAIWRKEADT